MDFRYLRIFESYGNGLIGFMVVSADIMPCIWAEGVDVWAS